MAEVFAGEAVGTQNFARPVAIKRVLPAYANDPQFVQLFAAEAQITSRLRHPNIVETLDFYRDDDGSLVLVMELVRGVNLSTLSETEPLPPAAIAYIVAEILRGLGHAHEQHLVHRDVSPHNVLLSWEGAVKVSDFGIAKARDATQATASILLKGKPAYMSPEQANAQALDGRSDLFAAGVILWELLTGRSLFKADDTRATLAAVLFGTVPHPRTVKRNAPAELSRIAMRLLEKDRDKRYPTAEGAIDELVKAYPLKEEGRRQLVGALATRFLGEATPEPVRSSRSGLFFALGVACVLAIVGVAVASSFRGGDDARSSQLSSQEHPGATVKLDAGYPEPRPFAKAAWGWHPPPASTLPPWAPQACVDEIAVLSKIVRCGRLEPMDREQFRVHWESIVKFFAQVSTPSESMERMCKQDLSILPTLGITPFIDCKLSMGDDG